MPLLQPLLPALPVLWHLPVQVQVQVPKLVPWVLQQVRAQELMLMLMLKPAQEVHLLQLDLVLVLRLKLVQWMPLPTLVRELVPQLVPTSRLPTLSPSQETRYP